MKKGFTILEMLLVIVILGIILSISGRFSYQYIQSTQLKVNVQEFVGFFDWLIFQTMRSNFFQNKKFDHVLLKLWSGSVVWYTYFYSDGSSWSFLYSLKNSKFWSEVDNISIDIMPYALWCSIVHDWNSSWNNYTWSIYFDISALDNTQKNCFELNSQTCRLYEKKCP